MNNVGNLIVGIACIFTTILSVAIDNYWVAAINYVMGVVNLSFFLNGISE